jgi:uncharacterized protein (TIGR03643 family)
MNEQALIRGTEEKVNDKAKDALLVGVAPASVGVNVNEGSAVGSVELMGKVWVANERNSKSGAIPDAVSDGEKQIILEDRIIEMAWEDRTPFEAIKAQFGYSEAQVIALMRRQLKRSSFNLWRKRVNSGISIKHQKLRSEAVNRFHCSRQKSISNNKISKR